MRASAGAPAAESSDPLPATVLAAGAQIRPGRFQCASSRARPATLIHASISNRRDRRRRHRSRGRRGSTEGPGGRGGHEGGFTYELVHYPWSCAYYVETGRVMPESMLDEYRTLDAILFGAVGDPRANDRVAERAIIFTLRFGLDLVNLRPVALLDSRLCPAQGKTPDDIDLVVVRENTEDVYSAIGGQKGTPDEIAVAEMIFTRCGVERVIRYGFELARKPRTGTRHVVDKSNVPIVDIWRRSGGGWP